jgi:hypothetical protein
MTNPANTSDVRPAVVVASIAVGVIGQQLLLFVSYKLVWRLVGADRALLDAAWSTTLLWQTTSVVIAALAAAGGSALALVFERSGKGATGFAALVLLLGAVAFVQQLTGGPTAPRMLLDPSLREFMQQSRQPLWVGVVAPLVAGGSAVVVARSLRRTAKTTQPVTPATS